MNEQERFWPKVDKGATGGCWAWTAYTHKGYGRFGIGSRTDGTRRVAEAHRWAYEELVGLIPDGLELDHLCRNRRCVNPAHLEPVTHRVNLLRGRSFSASNAAKTHCAHGHPFDEANTRRGRGERHCRTCDRKWDELRPPRQKRRACRLPISYTGSKP